MSKAKELRGGECVLIDGKAMVPVDVERDGDTVTLHFSNRPAISMSAETSIEIPSDRTMNFATA